jgi:hypothetical protein
MCRYADKQNAPAYFEIYFKKLNIPLVFCWNISTFCNLWKNWYAKKLKIKKNLKTEERFFAIIYQSQFESQQVLNLKPPLTMFLNQAM